MCGITGITDKQIENLEEGIQKMTKCIVHRGPDDDGYFVDEQIALGMRRLSIIDLEHGRQPITSRDGRWLIFFNGEIYNYRELKAQIPNYKFQTESDTEVILAGFSEWGIEVFRHLRGMFALAIYDTVAKKLILARDPFGIKPLYYWQRGNKIAAFSSEIKSFLSLKAFRPEVNDGAVYNYLSFQYNPLTETFFKGVFKLPPGHYISLDQKTGVFEMIRYSAFRFRPEESLDEERTRQEILSTMRDSVRHHMIADVPVGSFLSGGVDSSVIATLMQEDRGERIKTFTVTFSEVSEGVEARETALPLRTDHTEVRVSADEYFEALSKVVYHFDEPVADPSALGLYFLAREARKSVKVVLSGEGADELFGGYNVYLAPFSAERLRVIPRFLLKILASLPFRGSNFAKRALLRLEDWYIGNAHVFSKEDLSKIWKAGSLAPFDLGSLYKEVEGQSDSTKMQYIDINTWLVGDILAKADKMTMAHSLELRVPFLDLEVARLALKLPDRFKWRDGVTKHLLREAFTSLLPGSTRSRRKLGFPTPIRHWFTKDREDLYQLILANDYISLHFDLTAIRKLVEDHLSGTRDNSRKIYLLLVLAIWYNTFIK